MARRYSDHKIFIVLFLGVGCYMLAMAAKLFPDLIDSFDYDREQAELAELHSSMIRTRLTTIGIMLASAIVQFFLAWKSWKALRKEARV